MLVWTMYTEGWLISELLESFNWSVIYFFSEVYEIWCKNSIIYVSTLKTKQFIDW